MQIQELMKVGVQYVYIQGAWGHAAGDIFAMIELLVHSEALMQCYKQSNGLSWIR